MSPPIHQTLVALMARLGIARQQLAGTGAEDTLVAIQHELRGSWRT